MINMNAVTIESAEQKDYASWLPLWINYQTFYRTKISDEVTKLTWERFLTPNEPVYCAVAKYDGKIVGLVHYLFHRSTWAESNYCYLEDLFVSEDVRGQHIGKQLIEYVQQQANLLLLPPSFQQPSSASDKEPTGFRDFSFLFP